MCNHPEFLDLVTHWQCRKCGRIVEKITIDEANERIEDMIERLHNLEKLGLSISDLGNRVDAIKLKLNMPQYGKN